MPRVLKALWPALLLSLSACEAIPSLLGTAASTAASASGVTSAVSNLTSAVTGAGSAASAATSSASTAAAAIASTANSTTAGADPTVAPPTTSSATPVPTGSANKTITFDSVRKLEYVDVYVDMGDPSGQRALVPYLMKPKDWMLVGCEMTSTSSKHYRFMKVSTQDGRELPDVDIFKQGR